MESLESHCPAWGTRVGSFSGDSLRKRRDPETVGGAWAWVGLVEAGRMHPMRMDRSLT